MYSSRILSNIFSIAPIAGIDISFLVFGIFLSPIAPHCGD